MRHALWLMAPAVVAAAVAALAVGDPRLSLGLLAVTFLVSVGFARPDTGVALWLTGTVLIPCWIDAVLPHVGLMEPLSLIGLPVAVGVLFSRRAIRPRPADWLVIIYLVFVTLSTRFGTSLSDLKDTALLFGLAYLLGRYAGAAIGRLLGVLTIVVAAWSILEFAVDFQPFTTLDTGSPLGFWASTLTRGNLVRSEVTLGHPIALGAFLALGLPFVLHHFRWWLAWLAIVAGGILTTLSRGPIATGALTIALCLLPGVGLLALRRQRAAATGMLIAAGFAIYPVLRKVQESASAELSETAERRLSLLRLIHSLRPIGLSPQATFDQVSHSYLFGGFTTIDNTPLYLGLTQGWLTLLPLLIGVLAAVARYLRKNAGPATIALVGQIPVLLTVAPITQWGPLVWFVAGMAVEEVWQRRPISTDLNSASSSTTHPASRATRTVPDARPKQAMLIEH